MNYPAPVPLPPAPPHPFTRDAAKLSTAGPAEIVDLSSGWMTEEVR